MASIEKFSGSGGFSTFALVDERTASRVEVVPERGGIVTRFAVGDDEVLYLDESTLADRAKNVRGGIPVLFPICGRLPDDLLVVNGRAHPLKQHGFARNMSWEVLAADSSANGASLTMRIVSNEETQARFPWQFETRLAVALSGRRLTMEWEIANASLTAMPLHCGFHPYFRVDDAQKSATRVETDATRALDNRTGATITLGSRIDLTAQEVDLHLSDHRPAGTVLHRPGRGSVSLSWSGFRQLVIWTLAGKDFVCVEPWNAPAGVMTTNPPLVEPSFSQRFRFEVLV